MMLKSGVSLNLGDPPNAKIEKEKFLLIMELEA